MPRVKAAVEAHLRGKLDPGAAAALNEVLDLTRPALVGERWSDGKQTLEQHLVVGRPTPVPGYRSQFISIGPTTRRRIARAETP